MSWRRLAAVLVVIVAGWLLWRGIYPVSLLMSRGSDLGPALFEPPTSLWRIAAGLFCLIGGLLAVAKLPGGAWLAGLGAFLYLLLSVTLGLMAGEMVAWQVDLAASLALLAGAAILVFMRRK